MKPAERHPRTDRAREPRPWAAGSGVPFNRAARVGKELEYMADAIASGRIAGDYRYTGLCQELLQTELGALRVLLTPSCTHALEMAALLLDVSPGDEVILPSFTFVSTANAFALRGARPVFADIRPDTLNLDERQLESLITDRTRAIVPIHYAGIGCEMDAICDLAGRHGAAVVEDNAHGLFGRYRGRALGTFGALATQSFHDTKNITCGEGGALLVNDAELLDRAEIVREKGTNRSRFFRGMVDKYTWVDLGSSYLLADVLAAMLLAQLEEREAIQARRARIWDTYDRELQGWATETGATLPTVPDDREQAYHLYYMLLPSLEDRTALMQHLRSQGVASAFHYQPLNTSEMGRRLGGREGQCPVTEDVADRLLRLPFYNEMTEGDQARVIEAVHSFRS